MARNKKTIKLTIRFPKEVIEKIDDILEKESKFKNRSDFVRVVVSEYVDNQYWKIKDRTNYSNYKILHQMPFEVYKQIEYLVQRGYYSSVEEFINEALRKHIQDALDDIERVNNFKFNRKIYP